MTGSALAMERLQQKRRKRQTEPPGSRDKVDLNQAKEAERAEESPRHSNNSRNDFHFFLYYGEVICYNR